jgi:hypothetical protein
MTACAKHGRQLGHVTERASHRLVHRGADPDTALDAVVFHAPGEGIEDRALDVGLGSAQGVAQVGKGSQVLD